MENSILSVNVVEAEDLKSPDIESEYLLNNDFSW